LPDINLSLEEIASVRQLLGQVAPTPGGNVSKLRAKLYGPLDGAAVRLAREEILFLRNLLDGIVAVDEDDRPIEKPEHVAQIIAKLTEALAR
jgi:hypothetical protein